MKLETILLGLNGIRTRWNGDGTFTEVPTIGFTTNIVPFIQALGWSGSTDNVFTHGAFVYQFTKIHIVTELTQQLDMGPLQKLFYIAAMTPNINVLYEPEIQDKEKLLEMAALTVFQDDPLFGYMINTYNRAFAGRATRILKKELSNDFQYYDVGTVQILATRYMFSWNLSLESNCSQPTLYNLIYKDAETFKKIVKGEYNTTNNEAPCEILQYSTKVERYIKTELDPKKVFFGIELELEGHTETRLQQAHELLKKHCIFKRDGSITNGMEIVSKPANIQEHKEAFKPFFDANLGYKAESNCGIHIHASRGNMSFLQLGRIYAFMSKNTGSVIKIAGRESSYAKFDTSGNVLSPWYKVSGDKYVKAKRFSWDKYTAVNMAPEHTIEFRIFKSTTKWDEFCRFLEFPDALISYCSLAGNDNHGKIRTLKDMLMFSNFADFVSSRGSIYPNLNKFIQAECT